MPGGEPLPRHAEHGRRRRVSGAVRRLAVELGKIASDLRLLSMGPRAGLAEIVLPGGAARVVDHAGQGEPVDARDGQPGVLPGDRLRRHDRGRGGGRPARAERDDAGHRVERAARLHDPDAGADGAAHAHASTASRPTRERCRELLDRSTAVATALSPYIGYAATAEIAKESVRTGRPIRELVLSAACSTRRGSTRSWRRKSMTARAFRAEETRRCTLGAWSRGGASHGAAGAVRGFGRAVPLLAVSLCATARQHGVAQERPRHGRLFPPEELGDLEGPDRDAWQMPDAVMDALGIADGSHVADIGAGGGWFTVRLARRVGPNGVVYAQDVQSQMLEAIRRRVDREGLRNVRTVLGDAEDPRLPPASVRCRADRRRVPRVHEPRGVLARLAAALKPGGRIGVVDFNKAGGGPGPPTEERVDEARVIDEAKAAGLALLRKETFLPFQYFLVFGRAADASGSTTAQTR